MDPRILVAGLCWLLADCLEILRDSVEISREALLVAAGKAAGI